MKIAITSTDQITTLDGVDVRVWEGVTEKGTLCKVFVHRIASIQPPPSEFDRELEEQLPPGRIVDLRHILLIEAISRPQYLTRDQVHRLLAAAKPGRDRLFIRVAWETGARVGEILALSYDDFDLLKPFAEIRMGQPPRQVPIGESLRDELRNTVRQEEWKIVGVKRPFDFYRQTAWRIVRDAGRAAGLVFNVGELNQSRDITPDTLRHSFANYCVYEGVPLEIVQQVMGITPMQAAKYGAAADPARVREFLRKVQF